MKIYNEHIVYDIAPYQSRILISTSSLVAIPIYFAYQRGLYFYMITTFGTGFCSILYWFHPIHGWRRNLDLFYAKYSFLVYLASGLFLLPGGLISLVFYVGAISLIRCYFLSLSYPEKWLYYHILFHLISIATKTHVILSI